MNEIVGNTAVAVKVKKSTAIAVKVVCTASMKTNGMDPILNPECPKCGCLYSGPYKVSTFQSEDNRYLSVVVSFRGECADTWDLVFKRDKGMTEAVFEIT